MFEEYYHVDKNRQNPHFNALELASLPLKFGRLKPNHERDGSALSSRGLLDGSILKRPPPPPIANDANLEKRWTDVRNFAHCRLSLPRRAAIGGIRSKSYDLQRENF